MRDRDTSGKELSCNQRGQAPLEDAHSLKKQINISRKSIRLNKAFFKYGEVEEVGAVKKRRYEREYNKVKPGKT